MPVSPALDDDLLVFGSDAETAKVRNVRSNPRVALSFDDYSEDWRSGLRGVLILGRARVLDHGPGWDRGRDLLYRKYAQYQPAAPLEPGRAVIVELTIEEISDGGL